MQNYHRHSSYSNIWGKLKDSSVSNEDYAKRAVELNHKIISSVEHGWQGYYYETFELAKKHKLKFIFGTEAYWVKDRNSKDKTNNHIVILAKNEKGRRAINGILTEANETGYYFRPRIDLDLLLKLPKDDVFITTACIAFWKYKDVENILIKLKEYFGDNIMLEIQYHKSEEQIELNKKILSFSKKYNIEMIVGLDSHYIYPEQKFERDDLLKDNKIIYNESNEDEWYMDYPNDETVVERFLVQGVFSKEEIIKAMNNTDICLSFEDIYLNDDIKLPTLYPNKTQTERNKMYSSLITKFFKEYVKDFSKEEKIRYYKGVKKEVSTYIKTGMVDYPLIDYKIVKEAIKRGGQITDTGRGSGVGYLTNTLCGFSKVDRFTSPIKIYPERFISESRILETRSLPDLDLNVGNPEIFAKAQEMVLGKGHSYPMIAFGTLKKKSAFKMYARIKDVPIDIANKISNQIGKYEEDYKNTDDDDKQYLDIYDYITDEYKSYVKQSEKYWGIISDKKKAPCAYLLYSGDIKTEVGLIKCKSEITKKEYITTVIDGAIAEKYKFLKNDLLKVDVVLLINKIYERIGIHHHTVNELIEIIKDDKKTWDIYADGITVGINQCENQSTTEKAMRYKPKNLSELSAFIAGIRPSFKSMYSKFESREPFSYGIEALDNLLQTEEFPQSFILYQEQIMNVLNYAGFPMDECYSIIKAVAKKHPEKVMPLKEKFLNGFKEKLLKGDGITEEKATNTSVEVWKILSDFCQYGFNASHSLCMALDSLYCAYLKAHYPHEFYEVLLQHYSDKGDKDKVILLKKEMKKFFNILEGKYKFGLDNRKFVANKIENKIYPSLLSIKNISQNHANSLYDLSQNKYNNFYELWKDIKTKTKVYNNRLKILIEINYFSDFGEISELKEFLVAANYLYEKSEFKKEAIKDNKYKNLIIRHCKKETDKMYVQFDYNSALIELSNNLKNKKTSIFPILKGQAEHLGYISIVIPKLKNCVYITDVNTKYSPKISVYKIDTGENIVVKMNKKSFAYDPIKVYDTLKITTTEKPKYIMANDKWTKSETEKEIWIEDFKILHREEIENE